MVRDRRGAHRPRPREGGRGAAEQPGGGRGAGAEAARGGQRRAEAATDAVRGGSVTSLSEVASLEVQRATRTGRWFSLVRIAPLGWAALEGDMQVLASLARAHLRRTDVVLRVREREVGVVL